MANVTYESICEKLGFIPSEYKPEVSNYEDDSRVNPFSVLETSELLYLFDNGYMTAQTILQCENVAFPSSPRLHKRMQKRCERSLCGVLHGWKTNTECSDE